MNDIDARCTAEQAAVPRSRSASRPSRHATVSQPRDAWSSIDNTKEKNSLTEAECPWWERKRQRPQWRAWASPAGAPTCYVISRLGTVARALYIHLLDNASISRDVFGAENGAAVAHGRKRRPDLRGSQVVTLPTPTPGAAGASTYYRAELVRNGLHNGCTHS